MAELGETTDPTQLVPGDVSAITSTMWALRTYGDTLEQAGNGLARIDTSSGWRGAAADKFRDAFSGEPSRWIEAATCFRNAADAIDGYASTLAWAQRQAQEAITLWAQGVQATATARGEYDRAKQGGGSVPDFVDPGAATRRSAQAILDDARNQLKQAGDTANTTVDAARDKAPPEPGFWSKVGDFFGDVGDGLLHAGEATVNGLASFGNAMIHHPGDTALAAAGIGLMAISGLGDGVGVALDATGVGAIAGVPLNAVSTAGVVAGAGMTAAATGDLIHHAATDDQTSPLNSDSGESTEPVRAGTKTDRLKEHLTDRDLDAARRELNGETVATKPDGTPWDHVDEVRNAQRGLVNRINQLTRMLGDSRLSDADRAAAQAELSEASKLLDHSEGFVPRGSP